MTREGIGVFSISGDMFPMYYITNCSREEILKYSVEIEGFEPSEIPGALSKGDSYVSLLFTISGTCCVCWMLCVFLVLSPPHKRKPILTQLCTVFYTIVLTILLSKVTSSARQNYFDDHADVTEIHDVFFNNLVFRITNVFSEFFVLIAFLQIVKKLNNSKVVLGLTSVLIVAYVVLGGVCEGLFRYRLNKIELVYARWHQAKNSLRLVYVCIVGIVLANFTYTKKHSHSKKLISLAIFVWLLFVIHLVVLIFLLAVYIHDWGNRSWLSILPNLIEIGILSMVWEWIYDIRSLEKRDELIGVLGRSIAQSDAENYSLQIGHE